MRAASALRRDRSGSVSMEFALMLPAMLALAIGCFEVGWLLQAEQKVKAVASDMAELVAATANTTGTAYIPGYCSVGYLEVYPQTGLLQIAVASVTNDPSRGVTVDWNEACSFSSPVGDPAGLATASPSLVPQAGDSVILVQAAYVYTPPVHFVLLPTSWTLTATSFARPYNGATVQLSP
jgi:Flp pilus assembly protein TadG